MVIYLKKGHLGDRARERPQAPVDWRRVRQDLWNGSLWCLGLAWSAPGHSPGHCRPTPASLDPLESDLGPGAVMDQNDGCSEMLDILLLHTVLILYICSTRFEVERVEGGRCGSTVAGGVAQGTPVKP